MRYYSCGSDKYTEIKMCDLELFSKIRSHILVIKPYSAETKIQKYRAIVNISMVMIQQMSVCFTKPL